MEQLTAIEEQKRSKTKMNKYQKGKARAIEKAIEWQYSASEKNYYMSEIAYYYEYFCKLAKRYGLIKEFKENGII